ncbi:MAG TPA: pyridoxal-phosphate dependent enzyme, partial [Bacillota bacterium]|nr:pyridoxal-phosphate dependent enzyme [Bacillota bacterium]
MLKIPERIHLANLPTRIEKLNKLTRALEGPEIYIKRDDQTGTEFSGNKVRKLEYSVKEALDMGCNYLITCGGVQSNHCRATAAAAAKLGMKSCLVLRGDAGSEAEGNLLIDRLLGADIRFITAEEY